VIERRVNHFATMLDLDVDRVLRWAFAQAVLSAIWDIEDGSIEPATPVSVRLAEAIRPMLR
jgi:streptomycin 6-kinase